IERMNRMRDFSWKYFTMTGDVESYLLFKEIDHQANTEPEEEEDLIPDDTDLLN
ncbi:MAG: YqzL-like protein, partial [Paenibacillus sp.]|nr:YqzL-like protein [Paenibacillus sp.]